MPPVLRLRLERERLAADPLGHLSIHPGHGSQPLGQQGGAEAVRPHLGWALRPMAFISLAFKDVSKR